MCTTTFKNDITQNYTTLHKLLQKTTLSLNLHINRVPQFSQTLHTNTNHDSSVIGITDSHTMLQSVNIDVTLQMASISPSTEGIVDQSPTAELKSCGGCPVEASSHPGNCRGFSPCPLCLSLRLTSMLTGRTQS